MGSDHGVVVCRLCQRHGKANNFAGEGYRRGRPVLNCLHSHCFSAFTLLASAACIVQCLRKPSTPDIERAPARARQEGQAQRAGGPHVEEQGAQGAGG